MRTSILRGPKGSDMKSLRLRLLLAALSLLFFHPFGNSDIPAHPGRLDENCGHYNRETGEYHYHYENCKPEATRKGKVARVKDGDTVVIQPANGEKYTCRLYGIDAPETAKRGKPGQPYGEEAKDALLDLVLKKQVEVEIKDRDRYGRMVCIIRLDGVDINRKMIKLGLAWAYIEYLKGPYASIYYDAEKEARAKRLGLWQQANPQPPWEFRRMLRGR
jgi:endonuclease YncB( thermonuclease family)